MLTAILPPRCLKCGVVVDTAGALCPACWTKLSFIDPPCCACCGFPFEFHQGDGALCGGCMREPPDFARARSVLRYDEASKELILRFKHADRTGSAPAFAAWLKRAGAELLVDADLLAPVPLHWSRLLTRRYNQAALLTRELARLTGKPAVQDLLIRRRRTPIPGRPGSCRPREQCHRRLPGPSPPCRQAQGAADPAGGRCLHDRRHGGRLHPHPPPRRRPSR